MKISLCIATYRRPERLWMLLDDLVKQTLPPCQLVIVDNDAAGTALPAVERRRAHGAPFPIHYDIQKVKNISLTRNRCVEMTDGDWIAFIDDDERAPEDWLKRLSDAAIHFTANGVLGPVVPVLPDAAPAWIRYGKFYDWPRMQTGTVIPLNKLRFGNVLLRGDLLRTVPPPFDPDYGLTGGEDGDLLGRLVQNGTRIIWCDEAIVHEPVETARLSLRWLLLRSMRGGQDFARHRLRGSFGLLSSTGRVYFFMRALLQSFVAAVLMLLAIPSGRHRSVYWLLKASANIGKMSVFAGWHYREYGGKAT